MSYLEIRELPPVDLIYYHQWQPHRLAHAQYTTTSGQPQRIAPKNLIFIISKKIICQ